MVIKRPKVQLKHVESDEDLSPSSPFLRKHKYCNQNSLRVSHEESLPRLQSLSAIEQYKKKFYYTDKSIQNYLFKPP
jgi:hypothetical protein